MKKHTNQSARLLGFSLLAIIITAVVAGCETNSKRQIDKALSETLKQYETIIRWSQWDAAADFISPEYVAENPITRLDMDRLRLFRVTSYTLRSTGIYDEGMTARQVVEIKMFNNHQGRERTIIDEQEWRWSDTSRRWMLHSGLPDPTRRY